MVAANVTISELDLSTRVPSFPGLYIGMVLPDPKKGSVNTPTLCTNDTQFLNKFTPDGKVGIGYDNAYFSALATLQSSNKLWVIGASTTGMKWAGASFAPTSGSTTNTRLTTGMDDPEAFSFTDESILISGSSPRAWANDVCVQVFNYKIPEVVASTTNEFAVTQHWGNGFPVKLTTTGKLPAPLDAKLTYFAVNSSTGKISLAATQADALATTPVVITLDHNDATGTHTLRPAQEYTKIPDTFLIRVFRKSNLNQPVEQYVVSKTPGTKDGYSRNIYVEDVAVSSNFIKLIDNPLVSDPLVKDQIAPLYLGGGADGSASTDSDCIQSLDLLSNSQSYPVTLIIDGGRATVNYHKAIIELSETRMDCMGILSTPYEREDSAEYATAVVDYRTLELNAASSYAALYSSHVLIYDKYNDRDIYVSPDGFVAGLISQTAANFDMWWPVAGFRRGIMNVKDVRRRWTRGEMDYLYDNDINPIRFAVGRGIVVWGQKNLLGRESTLNRINVRLLLISIETMLKEALEDFLFEINDEDTRLEVTAMIDAGMERYQSRRGIYGHQTICDDTNNNGDDLHKLYVALIVKPAQSVEEIPLTIAIPRNTADFTVTINSIT